MQHQALSDQYSTNYAEQMSKKSRKGFDFHIICCFTTRQTKLPKNVPQLQLLLILGHLKTIVHRKTHQTQKTSAVF